jgi:hypothetical protein
MSFCAQKSSVEDQPHVAVCNVRMSSRGYGEMPGAESPADHGHRDVNDRISCGGRFAD